ncbi:MAG: hypothetical protein FJX42_00060 [Alphaproteobacteria bacterium]|nr:hypothetical protein [Alphaproteobacteria bacterium]
MIRQTFHISVSNRPQAGVNHFARNPHPTYLNYPIQSKTSLVKNWPFTRICAHFRLDSAPSWSGLVPFRAFGAPVRRFARGRHFYSYSARKCAPYHSARHNARRSLGLIGGEFLAQRGALYWILTNRLYRGEATHKGKAYPGQHPAIVDPHLWGRVHHALAGHRTARAGRPAASDCLLSGLIRDAEGQRMTPVRAVRSGKVHRYYVSQAVLQNRPRSPSTLHRVPAPEIERVVVQRIIHWLRDPDALSSLAACFEPSQTDRQLAAAQALAERLEAEAKGQIAPIPPKPAPLRATPAGPYMRMKKPGGVCSPAATKLRSQFPDMPGLTGNIRGFGTFGACRSRREPQKTWPDGGNSLAPITGIF